ncbi:insulin-like growth factor-binding protein 7 [Macrobrachium nipponense]|uniref:insulin-like growth factor-binding protein 7 n=1 Tax=Macrobrachium nipponense TaxID=159736 RepID=UPI0030C7F7A1
MLRAALVVTIFVLAGTQEAQGLSCLCNPQSCKPPRGCKYGLVKDACYCCDVCAKPWFWWLEDGELAMGGGLAGAGRKAGTAKLQAKQHVQKTFGGITAELRALLEQY